MTFRHNLQILTNVFSSEVLEKAFSQALRDFFPVRNKNPDPRAEFYALYQRESEDYDKGMSKYVLVDLVLC